MKKMRLFLVSALLMSFSAFAQKASIESTSFAIKAYEKKGQKVDVKIHNLKEAKDQIDKAQQNETTANDPKMWLMRAKTYMLIYSDTNGEGGKPCIQVEDPLEVAVNSMVNCHKADDRKKYVETSDAYNLFVNIAVNTRYVADVAYNKKEYDRSIKYYKLVRELIPHDDQSLLKRQNITDDGLLFNLATTTKLAGKNEDAKPLYKELISKAYNDPWIYIDLYDIYLNADKDTAKAIETIDAGRAIFEDDINLKRQQIYIYSVSGRSDELIQILNDAIELDPYNGNNYYLRGLMYIRMENEEKAMEDMQKATENNPELMDAWQELGQMYYKKGADLTEQANQLDLNETEKYNKLNEDAKASFEKSIPCFNEIHEMSQDPKQQARAAQFLMQMYLKTGQMDKYKEIKAQYQ